MAVASAPASLLSKLGLKADNPGAWAGPDGWIADAGGESLTSYNPTTDVLTIN